MYLFFDIWAWRDCLARSRITAIPHFASWALPKCKTAPASAHSRSNSSKASPCEVLVSFSNLKHKERTRLKPSSFFKFGHEETRTPTLSH